MLRSNKIVFLFLIEEFWTQKIRSECAQNYRAIHYYFFLILFIILCTKNGCVFLLEAYQISMYMCKLVEVGGGRK